MRLLYKILILLLAPIAVYATDPVSYDHTKKKQLHKEFTVNPDAIVLLNNKYGDMTITTNNDNKVIMDIIVKVSGNDEEDVTERLREIEVDFESSASRVSARTIIEEQDSGWRSWFSDKKNVSINISYLISMPINCDLDARNDYGKLSLDLLNGHAQLRSDYGSMDIGTLTHEDNYIQLDYAKKSRFNELNTATIRADYSSLTIVKAVALEYKADFSFCNFGSIKDLNINAEYGDVTITTAEKLIGRGDYVTFKIDAVSEVLDLNTDYGSITVGQLKQGFKEVTLRSDFTGIKLNYELGSEFTFTVDTEFGGINISDDLTVTRSESDYTEKRKEGYSLNKNSSNTISIRTSYGGVKLTSN